MWKSSWPGQAKGSENPSCSLPALTLYSELSWVGFSRLKGVCRAGTVAKETSLLPGTHLQRTLQAWPAVCHVCYEVLNCFLVKE